MKSWKRRSVPRQGTEVGSGWKNTFELESVASCRSGDHRWRTKLDFSSGESFDDHHRPTTLGARAKIARPGGGGLLQGLRCPAEQLEAKWQGGGPFAVGQDAEVADAHETFREQVNRKRRKNSSRDRVINFCSLLWAESRQRKVTFPSANEISRWLEMATRWV